MSEPTSAVSRELSPDVAKAQQCDAAGKHTEAINHLVAGVHKRDVEAMTRLGKRLLLGDRAPFEGPLTGQPLLVRTRPPARPRRRSTRRGSPGR